MCQVCGDEAHGEALPTDGEAETQSNVCLAGAAWTKGDDILAPVYPFAAGQFREHPVKHLSGYQGWVHADGYAGFNGVFGEPAPWICPPNRPALSGQGQARRARISGFAGRAADDRHIC